jgi:chromosomal replication initiation ATPase DnaA
MKAKKEKINQIIADFLGLMKSAVEKVGFENVFNSVNTDFSLSETKHKFLIAEKIIDIVCDNFSVSKDNLLKERIDGSGHDAMCFISFFLKKYANFTQTEIAEKLNRHKSQISKYVTKISQLKLSGNPHKNHLYQLVKDIDNQIIETLK